MEMPIPPGGDDPNPNKRPRIEYPSHYIDRPPTSINIADLLRQRQVEGRIRPTNKRGPSYYSGTTNMHPVEFYSQDRELGERIRGHLPPVEAILAGQGGERPYEVYQQWVGHNVGPHVGGDDDPRENNSPENTWNDRWLYPQQFVPSLRYQGN